MSTATGFNDSRFSARAGGTSLKPLIRHPSVSDNILLSVFIAGITIVFTLGAINLWTIGLKQGVSAAIYSWVPAAGNALMMALVGLFIIAFAYRAFCRFKRTSLWRPELAYSVLSLMIGSVTLLTYAYLSSARAQVLMISMLGCMVQVIAVGLFLLVIIKTARNAAPGKRG
jgi:apolipoprotein N-acyltransferase